MKRSLFLIASAALAVPASGMDDNPEMRACRDDMQKHCADVKPGDGRQMKCMYDVRDRLSPACASIVKQKYERFEQLRKAKEGR